MDIVINAAIQSPLFRNLSHIPADRLAFSHHITSNAPPLSKTKITVMPATAHNSLDADYQFRVPQFGFLNKVVLRLEYDILPVTRFQVTPLLPLYHIIQEISLRTHHKPIQTIYGKEMLVKHAYFTEPNDKGAKFLGTLNPPPGPGVIDLGEMFKDPDSGKPYDPIADVGECATRKRRVVMMVEVPLASTEAPHVNFDTRFVEHLDLYVKLVSTNNGDVPIGMAAGLMEQDLSQDFNYDEDTGTEVVEGDEGAPWQFFYGSGEVTGDDAFTLSVNTWKGFDWETARKKAPTAGAIDSTHLAYGYVVEAGPDSLLPAGSLVKFTGAATASTGAFETGSVAADGAITWTAVEAPAALTAANSTSNSYFVVQMRDTDATTDLTAVADIFHEDGYAATVAATDIAGRSNANVASYNRCTVAEVSGAPTFHRRNILSWNRAGKTASAVNNGPSIARSATSLNAIGTPNNPLCAMNWVRIGTGNFKDADYAGWGKSDTGTVYDQYSGNLAWGSDARTIKNNRRHAYGAMAESNHDPIGRPLRASAGISGGIEYNTGGSTTVGQRDVQAALERYYTLYPHLCSKVTVAGSAPSISGACADTTGAAAADGTDLAAPVLLGGRADDSSTLTAGTSSVNTSVPQNISLTLSCLFLNYHDKIREDIATENFKDNAPATILQYDTQQEIVNAKYGSSSSSYALNPYDEMVVHLKSNHLTYAISILAFKDKTTQELAGGSAHDASGRSISLSDGPVNDFGCVTTGGADQNTVASCTFPCYQVVENFKTVKPTYVAVKGSGRPIYECGIDATPSATGLGAQFAPKGSRGRIAGSGNCLAEGDIDNLSFNYNRTEGYGSVQGPETISSDFMTGIDQRITGGFSEHCSAHVISWGLNTTDQLANSGSLALQTINQPTLHLRFPEKCRVYVYVHHFSLIQIDSNTGSISKSLDV